MKDFNQYLELTGEVGYVEESAHLVCYASGLPGAKVNEVVMFEGGEQGMVLSLGEFVEILPFAKDAVHVGTKVARTSAFLEIPVGEELLGHVISPLGQVLDGGNSVHPKEVRIIDTNPPGVLERTPVTTSLETGVALVDLLVPLGRGQRELVIGDRKTGKTAFLFQTILTQARLGTVCIYAAVGKKHVEVARAVELFKTRGIDKQVVTITATSSDSAGLVFLAPFAAMTVAEYFRDKGKDVLVVLDDLTTHAKYYRAITLLARRFPGRNSYPGDVFFVHAKLLERAGKFKEGSITALPVAETILGDLAGYIQTNLMAMTDGHIFFDSELFTAGRRPAINPFLSVTRVGQQAQSGLVRSVSRELSRFLVEIEKLREFMHFGAELSEEVRTKLTLGDKVLTFFGFSSDTATMPASMSVLITAMLWAGFWKEQDITTIRTQIQQLAQNYQEDARFSGEVEKLLSETKTFNELVDKVRDKTEWVSAGKNGTKTN
ncbi:F0F1 ATP synthase subunit alpha [Candidatus Microgenomates bacterium]|nr:F0F1 ATP synthase subunit alpha [Candidatus Microgenomates bacterium]